MTHFLFVLLLISLVFAQDPPSKDLTDPPVENNPEGGSEGTDSEKYVEKTSGKECYNMYKNGSTEVKCETEKSCCMITMEFNEEYKVECVLRKNLRSNDCPNYELILSNYGAEVIDCQCGNYSIFWSFITIIFLNLFLII